MQKSFWNVHCCTLNWWKCSWAVPLNVQQIQTINLFTISVSRVCNFCLTMICNPDQFFFLVKDPTPLWSYANSAPSYCDLWSMSCICTLHLFHIWKWLVVMTFWSSPSVFFSFERILSWTWLCLHQPAKRSITLLRSSFSPFAHASCNHHVSLSESMHY